MQESHLIAQYFLNHDLRREELDWQVKELAQAGYDGLSAHARQGLTTPYMSEAWWDAMRWLVDACRRNGLQFWIWDEDYFPSGLAGGRVVWEDPGFISRGLRFSIRECSGAGPFSLDFDAGGLLRAFAVCREPAGAAPTITDVTAYCGTRRQTWGSRHVQHGAYSPLINRIGPPHWRCTMDDNRFALEWRPPRPGAYTVVAVLVCSQQGVHPDILRPEPVERFLELSYQPYHERFAAEFGKIVTSAFTDEPSPGHMSYPWTHRFAAEFKADHGYDLLPHLAHLALDLDDRSPVVRHHYRLTQHRLQRTHYCDRVGDWCRRHGLAFSGHLTRTEWLTLTALWWPNELRMYQAFDIPACDPLGAACAWPEAAAYHTGIKTVVSAARLFGRRLASSDALAVVGDSASLRDLKFMLDYQMVLGINHFHIHGLSYSLDGPRKDEVPPSVFYQHSEWPFMRVLLEHTREVCRTMSAGEPLVETALMYPSTSLACLMRPDLLEATGANLPDERLVHAFVEELLSRQKDFDFIDEVTLRERIETAGALPRPVPYRFVVLPHLRYIDARTADALKRFMDRGGQVIAVGCVPAALGRTLNEPLSLDWAAGRVRVFADQAEAAGELPGCSVEGEGHRDVFVTRRKVGAGTIGLAFNRREEAFVGNVDGAPLRLPPRGSALRRPGQGWTMALWPAEEGWRCIADWSSDWQIEFPANTVPLAWWAVGGVPGETSPDEYLHGEGYDLLGRQPEPAERVTRPTRYNSRFFLTGPVAGMSLVTEDAAWREDASLFINGHRIADWRRTTRFDCRGREADIRAALRTGSTPTLNVVVLETSGGGLREVPYLVGDFTTDYR
ncbi:MAG: glycosyl hydrolase, partial [Kiritimatiellae bacterium]|nr:glycosyl hydrolase [Kiritimatiellia bacterium]